MQCGRVRQGWEPVVITRRGFGILGLLLSWQCFSVSNGIDGYSGMEEKKSWEVENFGLKIARRKNAVVQCRCSKKEDGVQAAHDRGARLACSGGKEDEFVSGCCLCDRLAILLGRHGRSRMKV